MFRPPPRRRGGCRQGSGGTRHRNGTVVVCQQADRGGGGCQTPAAGQAGVENVLDILRGGIDSALMGLGKASVHDLTPDDIVIPPGFTRALGIPPELST